MSQPLQLVIVGAGGHGREIADTVAAINAVSPSWELLGFLDDREPDRHLLAALGVDYLGPTARMGDIPASYVIGMGSPAARRLFDERSTALGRTPATLVHPRAYVGRDVVLGPGSVLAPQANVTTHVTLGRHVHLDVAATVGHDCGLDDYVTVAPGARVSGGVTLEPEVFVGAGATLIQGVRVGRRTTVGAGAVVTRDLPPNVVAVGVPARLIRAVSGGLDPAPTR